MPTLSFVIVVATASVAFAQEPQGFENSVGMRMVPVAAGEFAMGKGEAAPKTREQWLTRDWDESPAHKVRISRGFHLGSHEVTNAQFEKFEPEHAKRRNRGADNDPVAHVTWKQATDFCAWLARKEGKPYRLPTEAEWEFACRAGSTTDFSTGDAITPAQANLGVGADGKGKPIAVPVGSYPANSWGLFDMHGNVGEWCLDWHGPYEAGEQVDPVGRADGYARVVRGGGFASAGYGRSAARFCRSSNRSGRIPQDADRFTGFRVAMGELPATKPLPEFVEPHRLDVKQGPPPRINRDPAQPLLIDYTKNKTKATIPSDAWGPVFAQWNHFASVCACPNGDLLAVWYTTVSEEGRELAQGATRLRAGSDKWDPVGAFFDVPDMNDHAPVLLIDGKRIWHFCTQSHRGWDDATDIVRWSDDNGVTWSKPEIMVSRDSPNRLSQPCSAFVRADGTIVLACDGDGHRDERVVLGSNRGTQWQVTAGCMRQATGKYAIHPAVVPAGDAILAFVRGPDPMPLLRSDDLGKTWQVQATTLPGISVGQKSAALRLSSGAILLVSADSKKVLVGGGTYAALSMDDGRTWPHVKKVENVGGYMGACQAADGSITVFGSRMGAATFNEAWIKAK